MPDFLKRMEHAGRERCEAARRAAPERELRAALRDAPPPRTIPDDGFLLIAELKRAAPSAGVLATDRSDLGGLVGRARDYAEGGAGAVSVLTEPSSFRGSLDDLRAVAAAVPLPVMRKDFLVDPYQVLEARAAGASGVLLIARILGDEQLGAMSDAALDLGLFVLLEAFDERDLERICACVDARRDAARRGVILAGLNARNLADLTIDPGRLQRLVAAFPAGARRIAESGLRTAAEVRRLASIGYDGALVGSALMTADDPPALCRDMAVAGREGAAARSGGAARADAKGGSACA